MTGEKILFMLLVNVLPYVLMIAAVVLGIWSAFIWYDVYKIKRHIREIEQETAQIIEDMGKVEDESD